MADQFWLNWIKGIMNTYRDLEYPASLSLLLPLLSPEQNDHQPTIAPGSGCIFCTKEYNDSSFFFCSINCWIVWWPVWDPCRQMHGRKILEWFKIHERQDFMAHASIDHSFIRGIVAAHKIKLTRCHLKHDESVLTWFNKIRESFLENCH